MYGLATQAKILPLVDGAMHHDSGCRLSWDSLRGRSRGPSDQYFGGRSRPLHAGRGGCSRLRAIEEHCCRRRGGQRRQRFERVYSPANHAGVIDVAAIDQGGHLDQYSHSGSDVTVAAPGVDIEVPYPNGQYGLRSGSSQAAPWVAGEAALIIGKHPDWTVGQVVRVIIENTVQAAGKRIDDRVGYGVIDPLKALGASAPSDTSNPLGGPAVSVGASASSGAGVGGNGSAGAASTPAAASSGKSSSNVGLYAGLGVGVLVLIGLIVFLITRGKNNNGPGGGGGGGGGNGYYPPTPGPGGQYAQPPQSQQYPASSPTQHYQGGSGVRQVAGPQSQSQSPYSSAPPSAPRQQYSAPPPHGYGK